MRKFLIFVVGAAIVALGILYWLRVAERRATATVTALLPKDSLFFVHLRDLRQARRQWRETDLSALWHEPAVQDFLKKPLGKVPHGANARSDLQQFEKLEPEDLFVAVTAWTDGPKLAGGFRFQGTAADVEKVVAPRRAILLKRFPQARQATQEYQQHQIQVIAAARQMVATAYNGQWFFAANNLEDLKALLDRTDHRGHEHGPTLETDADFSSAFAHMPPNYALLGYTRMDRVVDKMKMLLAATGATDQSDSLYRKVKAVCGTLAFDGGQMRDVLFVGMPKQSEAGVLTRASLQLGTSETLLYLATLLNPEHPFPFAGLPLLQNPVASLQRSGVTLADWSEAFEPEAGLLAPWPASSRLPALLAAFQVKNAAKARALVEKFTGPGTGVPWTREDKDGVAYYSTPNAGLFSFAPTFALSDHRFTAGTDRAAIEKAMKQAGGAKSALSSGQTFQKAEGSVPLARQAFFYLDTALLFERLDATLRPVLTMGAAFWPAINESIDLSKWPPAETITKHLSPIVMSQNYRGDGYITESVGPITVYQAALGTAVLVGGSALIYNQHTPGALGKLGQIPGVTASPGTTPALSPAPNPLPPALSATPSPSSTP